MGRPKTEMKLMRSEVTKNNYLLREKSLVTENVRKLSITGADVLFIVFSPNGTPFICLGENTEFTEIIRRYGALTFEEREKRRLKNFGTLKTCLQLRGHDVDTHVLSNAWKRKRIDDLNEELSHQRAKLTVVNQKRSLWTNLKNFKNIEQIEEMAEPLRKSIDGLHKRKDHLLKHREEIQKEVATEQIQSLHYGTFHHGINEKSKQSMPQGSVEYHTPPAINTENVESVPKLNFTDPPQHSIYDVGRINNFSFGSELGYNGLDLDFTEEFENLSSYSFGSIFQNDEAGPSNVDISSSAESLAPPTINTQNVESGPKLDFPDPPQHSTYDMGSYNNFSFGSDQGYDGLNFNFMKEFEKSSYSLNSIFQSHEAGPSNVDISSSSYFGGF